jgi:hypothetical protein
VNKTLHPLLAPFVISSRFILLPLIYVSKRVLGSIYPIQFLFKKREKKKRKKERVRKKIKRE